MAGDRDVQESPKHTGRERLSQLAGRRPVEPWRGVLEHVPSPQFPLKAR